MKQLTTDRIAPLAISALSISAISTIAVHALGWMPLYYSARIVVIPAFAFIFIYAINSPQIGQQILKGWLFGLIAVSFYDLSRIPFLMMGWGDFIPSIGNWVMGTEDVNPLVGYAWRYIGNGGGLGIAFVLLMHCFKVKGNKILIGTVYGILVWATLTMLLVISPNAQELLFSISPLSLMGSFIGHFVYGLVLGLLLHFSSRTKDSSIT
jgi:uncharacterized membrane protein